MVEHPTPADARLASIFGDTTDEVFEMAGGFAFTDDIAVALNAKWRKQNGPVIVSAVDLAWLLDGYARSRLAAALADHEAEVQRIRWAMERSAARCTQAEAEVAALRARLDEAVRLLRRVKETWDDDVDVLDIIYTEVRTFLEAAALNEEEAEDDMDLIEPGWSDVVALGAAALNKETAPEVHEFMPQPGCNVCVCGALRDDPYHLEAEKE